MTHPPLDLEGIKDKLAKLTETPYKSFPMVIFDDIRALLAECERLRAEVVRLHVTLTDWMATSGKQSAILNEMAEALEGMERFLRVAGEASQNIVFENAALEHCKEAKDALEKYEKWKGER